MKRVLIGIISLGIACAAHSLEAQDRWNIEVRGGAAFPTQDLAVGTELDAGFGFEGTVAYRVMPHLAAYAGWGWNQFAADQSFAGADVDFEETGYTVGLQFVHPLGTLPVNYLLRAGGLYNHIEAENTDGDIIGDSDHEFGWQVEAGLAIPLGNRWQVTPGVRYRSLSNDVDVDGTTTAVDLTDVSVGAGISWMF